MATRFQALLFRLNDIAWDIMNAEGSLAVNMERMKAPLGRVLEGESNIWMAPKLYLLKQIYKERGGL